VRAERTVIGTRMSFHLVLQLLVVEHDSEAVWKTREKKEKREEKINKTT
jgi:hypothetical protein